VFPLKLLLFPDTLIPLSSWTACFAVILAPVVASDCIDTSDIASAVPLEIPLNHNRLDGSGQ
jgi:hypothetical protein